MSYIAIIYSAWVNVIAYNGSLTSWVQCECHSIPTSCGKKAASNFLQWKFVPNFLQSCFYVKKRRK